MIYTLTVNPAIDYHMDLTGTGLQVGMINRSSKETAFPGGKGVNVSVILSRLGIPCTTWAFAAGKTGRLFEELAGERGCVCDFVYLGSGETRINVKLDCEQETAVNGNGPVITAADEQALLQKMNVLTGDDTIVLSGKLPAGAEGLYRRICEECAPKGVRIIVDTEGEDLRDTFRYHPFLIKPNREELFGMFGEPEGSQEKALDLMHRCREEGARNVMVSLGREGSLLLTEDGRIWRAEILRLRRMVSTVGAGDSMIGGLLAGLERYSRDWEAALALASAAGSATAYTKWLAEKDEIESVLNDVRIRTVQERRPVS